MFGSGKVTLSCLSGGCQATFPISQVAKALPANLFAKYEERLAEVSVVGIADLVKCPFCSYMGTFVQAWLPGSRARTRRGSVLTVS